MAKRASNPPPQPHPASCNKSLWITRSLSEWNTEQTIDSSTKAQMCFIIHSVPRDEWYWDVPHAAASWVHQLKSILGGLSVRKSALLEIFFFCNRMKVRPSVSLEIVFFVLFFLPVISLLHYCFYASLLVESQTFPCRYTQFRLLTDTETCCADANLMHIFKNMVRTPSESNTRSRVTEILKVTRTETEGWRSI